MVSRLETVSSGLIHLTSGVKQGDPLSPVLFNIVMDQLLESLNESNLGVILDGMKLPALAYADDLALMATSDRRHYGRKRLDSLPRDKNPDFKG